MKTLIEVINECVNEQINESLQSSWLQKLMKEIKEKGLKNITPKSMIGYGEIRWDKVTDDYCTEYEAGDSKARKIAKQIIKAEKIGLILVLDKSENIKAVINGNNRIMSFMKYSWDDAKWRADYVYAQKQYESLDLLKENKSVIYVFDPDNDPEGVCIDYKDNDSVWYRSNNKAGIVLQGDTEYYTKLAEENVKRYKDIIANNKAKKLDSEIDKRVREAVDKVMDLAKDMSVNPDKYNSTWPIESLLDMLYSKQSFDAKKYKTVGQNGLLVLYKDYIRFKKGAIKDSRYADMYYKNAKNVTEAIEQMLTKIEDVINKVK